MPLQLNRPLVIFDLETTGLNIGRDRIVELSYLKVFPNGTRESKTYRINPEIPIPPESSAVHGITDDDIRDCPRFKDIASEFVCVIKGCDLAGYNSNTFDIPLLAEELLRAGIDFDLRRCRFVDAYTIFQKKEPHTLTAAYRFYCNKDLIDAHSANADTQAAYEVLCAQVERYPDLPDTIEQLAEYSTHHRNADFAGRVSYDADGNEIFTFGKYKGQRLDKVLTSDIGYYGWLMQGDFPEYTKRIFTRAYVAAKTKSTPATAPANRNETPAKTPAQNPSQRQDPRKNNNPNGNAAQTKLDF